jgi:DNA polymerase III alpha subunit
MDISDWVSQQCSTPETQARVAEELRLFAKHDMIPVLKTMTYIVDTLRANNIVWGVGRGSSVASYVLHVIGVHKIDPIKYNIPIEEFFKGETNG